MKYIDAQDVKYIAIGASLLGSGGGGDPYIGELMTTNAIKKHGKVKLYSINEIKDDDEFLPASCIGAPSIGSEKIPKGDEFKNAYTALEHFTHHKFTATYPIEVGGINSLMPVFLGAQEHIPVVDCDATGRAFPGVQMSTLAINGVPDSPASITDEKGNMCIIHTINPNWSEKILRAICVEMGGSASSSQFIASGKQLKAYGIPNTLALSEKIGKIVCNVPYAKGNSLQKILRLTNGYHLFDGKVIDITHKIKGGFNFGSILIDGLDKYKGQKMRIHFQNENLLAVKNGKVITSTPDLICLTDYSTLMPTDSQDIKYGKRISVLGIPSSKKWRTKKGLKTVGPRYFGYDFNYVPIEKLVKKDN